MMQSASGRGVNPLKYQLFEGVAFRTFTYSFTLRPRNRNEAVEIQSILHAFKKEALPGVAGTNSRIYTFPTEWSIQFVGPIKDWVDFPLVSVCTGVNVDYAGGQPMALHQDGSPSVVTLTVNFTETTQLNRQKYENWVSNLSRDLESVEGGTSINTAIASQGKLLQDQARERLRGGGNRDLARPEETNYSEVGPWDGRHYNEHGEETDGYATKRYPYGTPLTEVERDRKNKELIRMYLEMGAIN